jgi:amino acid transporter
MSILLIAAVAIGKNLVADVEIAPTTGELSRKVIEGLQKNSLFDLLTNFVIFSSSIFAMLAVVAVFVLRWKMPTAPRPYRTLGYPVTPLLFLAVFCWFLTQVYYSNALEARTGLLMIAAGIPVYLGYRWFASRK